MRRCRSRGAVRVLACASFALAAGLVCSARAGAAVDADVVTGADAGGGPHVQAFDGWNGAMTRSFFALPSTFTGGVRVAAGDVNGDGRADLVTAPGPGSAQRVQVFDGVSGSVLRSFYAYNSSFMGGEYVAVGDVNGDGKADIVTGAGPGGGPHVQVFDGATGNVIRSFFAYSPSFTGGVRVAAADVNGDGKADIVTAPGPGGGPQVEVFDGATGNVIRSFFAYAPTFTAGLFVAAGDVNGDGKADIITGAGAGGGPHVQVFDGATGKVIRSFFAYATSYTGGVRVAAGDVNADGKADIVTGTGPGGGPHVEVFDGGSGALLRSFLAYAPSFTGGLFVASGDVDGPPDMTAPSTPTNLQVTGTTSSSISVSWTASTDNVGVTGYGHYLNNNLVSTSAGTSYTFTNLPCNTSETLAVDATDAAANRSGKATLTATTSACSAGPTVTVTNTTVRPLTTQISTNNVYAGVVDQWPAGTSNFDALGLPLVRIHVGDDGTDPPALPEVKQGVWNFSSLDRLVNDEFAYGQQPVINIKFAPDWMWTCSSFGQTGQVADQTFQTFAAYMARLVSYYNRGNMTTESGQVITNPAGTSHHITYWELWNEPDLDNETPCAPSTGVALTPSQYLTMWNAVTAAMLAVDSSLKFIGPATAGGQFGSGAGTDYFTPLMGSGANVKPYALSFHGYGYWDNAVTDKVIFDGDSTGAGGIADFVTTARSLHSAYPTTPIWITEMNVNSAWGNDPNGRPWGPYAAAWWGAAFAQLAPTNVALLHQYNVCESPQFGLISDQDGTPRLPYWIVKTLNAAFPAGSTQLQASSSDSNIQTLAARRPDGKVSILVVDRRVDSAHPSAGVGLSADVQVSLSGLTSSAVSLQQIDTNTPVGTGPAATTVAATPPYGLHFPGYGLAILTVAP